MNNTEQAKSKKPRVDFRTILLTIAFMLFIFLLVTLLMPRNDIIGIFLQTLAGLIFIVDQMWNKVIERDFLAKLNNLLGQPPFQQKLPLLVIPITTAILLIAYYKVSATNLKWFEVFFSMTMAVSCANFFYFMLIIAVPRWLQRIRRRKIQVAEDTHLNRPLRSNWIVLVTSTVVFIAATLALFPLSKLSLGHSFLTALPLALYLTILMIVLYGWLLSLLYFILYALLKLGYALSRIRLKISDPDKIFVRRMIWSFLLLFWLWGGVLLVLNTW